MDVVLVAALGVVGLLAGSLVNAAVLRWVGWRVVLPQLLAELPGPGALRRAPPRCAECGAPLAPMGLPAISWVVGGGRCRGAGRHPVGTRYLAVEALTGLLWAASAAVYGEDLRLLPVLVLATGLVAMGAADLWVMRIPNRFVYATYAALLPSIVAGSLVEGAPGALAGAAVGGGAYFAFLLLFFLVSPRRMGFGDVRLAGVMGVALGWLGWFHDARSAVPVDAWALTPLAWVVWAALLGSLLGTVLGLAALLARRSSRPFPFGPSLAAGCLIVVLLPDLLLG